MWGCLVYRRTLSHKQAKGKHGVGVWQFLLIQTFHCLYELFGSGLKPLVGVGDFKCAVAIERLLKNIDGMTGLQGNADLELFRGYP